MNNLTKAAVGVGIAGALLSPDDTLAQHTENGLKPQIATDTTVIKYPFDKTKPGEISFSDNCDSTYVASISEIYSSLENSNDQSSTIREFKTSMAREVKRVGVEFLGYDDVDKGLKETSKGGYYNETNQLFINVGKKEFFDEKNTPEINTIHEFTHLLNNHKFPAPLDKGLSGINAQSRFLLNKSFAMSVANTIRDNPNINISKEQFRNSVTDNMADYYSKFLYNPDLVDNAYVNSIFMKEVGNLNNVSSPVYNKEYKALEGISPDVFSKYLTDTYSNIVPGFELIDSERFIERVEKNKAKYLGKDKDEEWLKYGEKTENYSSLDDMYERNSKYIDDADKMKKNVAREKGLPNGSNKSRKLRLKNFNDFLKLTQKATRDNAEFSAKTTEFDEKYDKHIEDAVGYSRRALQRRNDKNKTVGNKSNIALYRKINQGRD